MRGFLFKIQHFIGELQRADLKTRKRWLIGLSGVSMIFVVILWVVYLNVTFPSYNSNDIAGTATSTQQETAEAAPQQETVPQTSGTSFFDTLGRGLRILGGEITNGFRTLGVSVVELWNTTTDTFSKTNSYDFKKQETPSVESAGTTTPDPVPPTPLPELPGAKKP